MSAAAAQSMDWRWRNRIGSDFERLRKGRRVLYLHRALIPHADLLMARVAAAFAGPSQAGVSGGRQSAVRTSVDGIQLVARRGMRGGLISLVLAELHAGLLPRPIRELAVAAEARRRGIAVAEPMGAMVEWIAPALYRGCFITRALEGMTLWEFARADDDPIVRAHVVEQTRRAIDTMHERGLFHADLNLHNLFVTRVGDGFAIVILDLDKARLHDSPLAPKLRRRNLARLNRSILKLDPLAQYFDSYARSTLSGA